MEIGSPEYLEFIAKALAVDEENLRERNKRKRIKEAGNSKAENAFKNLPEPEVQENE